MILLSNSAIAETMVNTAFIRECIEDGTKTKEIRDAIAKGFTTYGMQTFDQSLMYLLEKSLITYEEALLQSSNPDDFALKVRGIYSTSDTRWEGFDARIEQEKEEADRSTEGTAGNRSCRADKGAEDGKGGDGDGEGYRKSPINT
jgi:twitching motility protein PilT